jgi:hypothetical protein
MFLVPDTDSAAMEVTPGPVCYPCPMTRTSPFDGSVGSNATTLHWERLQGVFELEALWKKCGRSLSEARGLQLSAAEGSVSCFKKRRSTEH